MVSKFPDIASRLAHIKAACQYPTDTAFTEALGVKPQNLRNWRERGSIGTKSRTALREVTGVSLDWLDSGRGEPFPEGPKLYDGPQDTALRQRLEALEKNQEDIVAFLGVALARFSATTPAAGAAVAADLRRFLSEPDRPSAVLAQLLALVDAALPLAAPAAHGMKPKSSR